ncbi:MAG: hypothetical protein K2W88_16975 [Pararheinheimera sp.]|nr:hypothetical protein [Rheinheimera sp.]
MSKLKVFLLFLITVAGFQAHANLMISPLRVVFADDDRMQEVALINNGNEEMVYRIEWVEQLALPQGGYQPLNKTALPANYKAASSMIRFSPRQVRLKPGERQTIKLSARKPNSLAKGDYRSHLVLRAIPTPKKADAGLVLRAVVSYSLPVMIRNGEPSFKVAINKASMSLDKTGTNGAVQVELSRNGDYSSIGNLVAYWKPAGSSTETEIARLNDLSLYREVNTATPVLQWRGNPITKGNGALRVEYSGVKEYRSKNVLSERIFQISSGEIKPM